MNDMKTVMLQLLEETITHYNSTNRATDPIKQNCLYTTSDGKHCAIGRVMDPKFRNFLLERNYNMSIYNVIQHIFWEGNRLIEPYQKFLSEEIFLEFIQHLQGLHDVSLMWNEQGLTDAGVERVKFIKGLYKLA
jgi:hypothetical protein